MDDKRLSLRADIAAHKKLKSVDEEFYNMKSKFESNEMVLEDDIYDKSTITQYFVGKTIFITGGAGFLGQLYIEKLLRIGAKRVYCLLRPKKNLAPEERIKKLCTGPVSIELSLNPFLYVRIMDQLDFFRCLNVCAKKIQTFWIASVW